MKPAALVHPPLVARRSWVQGRRIYFEINDRRSLSFPATKYALLENALQSELNKIRLSADGTSVTWDSLNEEIQIGDVAANHFVHTARS
ncbi:DUF2442 domain-containing protein [Oleiharenicola lentus]|uniref:DUF2442 domain-containing protein n=1 Tax=Oleiharenicola lentus TaxID=2508720 RepID=UPI003F673E24